MSTGSRTIKQIESSLWKRLKKFAVDQERSIGEIVSQMIRNLPGSAKKD
jgi:hypothetical protein